VNVVVVNPSKTRIDLPNIQAIVEQYSAAIEDENIAAVKLNVDWKTVAHAKEAVRLIQNIVFRKKVLSGSIASVVLAQMDLDESVIHSELPIVAESFPIVKVPWHSEDSRFPSLGWLQEVSRTMVIRFLQSDSWWSSAVATANYAQIPAGNLETDVPLFASDVLFARLLRQSNHILWASDSGFPDLGGIEEGEDFFEKDIENPEVLFSKLYRSPCLEISIDNLCANAMLFGGTIQTMEGVEQAESVEAGSYVQGDVSGVQSAFKVLRAFVANLFSDIAQNQNEVADQILQHFYRWLRSRSAKLYDPMLHKMVHQLMTKVFLRLCSEFKRHGAELVYGNFNKIIITTSKPYLENAISSAKFLVQSIFSSDVFSCISIEYERLWEMLIYLDSYNFQGIEYQGSHDVQEEGQVSDPTSRMSAIWNISSYLPSDARDYFLGVISEFLVSLYRSQLEVLESTSEVHLDAETISDQVSEKMKTYLSANASSKLFSIVDWISKELSGDERRPNGISTIFPKLPGSYLSFHSPALEFVKMVMHVMKLDSGTAEEIDVLRNGLLKFLGYGSFSPEAQFRNPCSTIILPDITCEFCNHSRDLDLARDDEILKGNWKCTICDHDYNVAAIEIELVRGVLKTSAVYQCQDLICKRCKTVKMDNMSDFCSCSGTYLCSENAEHFRLRLWLFLLFFSCY
jgi:DNA polymerase epsilon subunit 1